MGVRNFLVEGGSCAGKSAVCAELRRRGFHAVDGDRDLAYQGDPRTGAPVALQGDPTPDEVAAFTHEHHIWPVEVVRALVADQGDAMTFFCGGSRNHAAFIDLFDEVFVLDLDLGTLLRRLEDRDGMWGSHPAERAIVLERQRTKQDLPVAAVLVDATAPLDRVVDEIVRLALGHR